MRVERQRYAANKLGGYFFQPLQVQKKDGNLSNRAGLLEHRISSVGQQVDKLELQLYDYYTEAKDRYQTDLKLVNLFSTNHVDFLDPLREVINEEDKDNPTLFSEVRTLAPYLHAKTQNKLTSRSFLKYGNLHGINIENRTGTSSEWDWKTYFARRERGSLVTFSNLGPNSLRTIDPRGESGKILKLSQDGGRHGFRHPSQYAFRFLTSEGNLLSSQRNELQYYEKSVGEKYETVLDSFISLDWALGSYFRRAFFFT